MLGALLWVGAGGACDADAEPAGPPAIPADHPCPAWAIAPLAASLYDDAVAADTPVPLALALPLPPGVAVRVAQGNAQAPTHLGAEAFAWDFAVPLDTPVYAAAPGVVAYVRDDSTATGPDASFRSAANFVLVDHGGGLFTDYVHLAQGGARVTPGDHVAAGDLLGYTGLSGQLTGPHLHFAVENAWSETLPARFIDPARAKCTLAPGTDDLVTAGPDDGAALVVYGAPSALPPDAFAASGVTALDGLPARLLRAGEGYRVRGAVDDPTATDVWVLLLPAGGGTALASWRFPLVAGAFAGPLRVAAPAGRYGLGAVAVAPGAPVAVTKSVRVTVE